ncbi:MAG: pantoate--beta-alanine ligase [Acidobacteria bacterium]|nr:pantoate--beta-alanine ligase [Acidobacteriota bacterium]
MTRCLHTVGAWQRLRVRADLDNLEIGFVPTLGALHRGHASLIERSLAQNDVTVLSVFLNPTQFSDGADLESYPASFSADRETAVRLGVDYLFCPSSEEMYPNGYRYRVVENELSRSLCGEHRPGHFDGVLTVVLKLLHIIRPTRAYFGEKDFQQLELVRGLVRDFFLDVAIVACPTLRHEDGLAVSSRNALLSRPQRRQAALFAALLGSRRQPREIRRELEAKGFEVEYIQDSTHRRFGAVRLGGIRLIDNVPLDSLMEETR